MIEKIFRTETAEIIKCFKNIKIKNNLFNELCKIAELTIKNKGKLFFVEMVVVLQMRNI